MSVQRMQISGKLLVNVASEFYRNNFRYYKTISLKQESAKCRKSQLPQL
jgi:hypothetical protein